MMVAWLAAGCTPAPSAHAPTEPSDPADGSLPPIVLVDASTVSEAMIAAEAGQSIYDVQLVDLDADGELDAVVQFGGLLRGFYPDLAFVFGPLVGRTVPSDAHVVLPSTDRLHQVGEFDGQPPVDFLYDGHIVPGPWDGGTVPEDTWVSAASEWPTRHDDLDHDGVLDRVAYPDHGKPAASLTVTFGPLDRWSDPADLIVAPLCRGGQYADDEYPWDFPLHAPGDLDSDGVAEVSVPAYGYWYDGRDCGDFTFSVGAAQVDPFDLAALGAWDRLTVVAEPIGDANGDGLTDWLEGESRELRVLLSPITLADGALGGQSVAMDPLITSARALPFDRTGDGSLEIAAWLTTESGVVRVVVDSDDPAAIGALPLGTVGYTGMEEEGPSFVEGGRAYVTYFVDGELRRIDVGPDVPR
jgi:hypothetical protein